MSEHDMILGLRNELETARKMYRNSLAVNKAIQEDVQRYRCALETLREHYSNVPGVSRIVAEALGNE